MNYKSVALELLSSDSYLVVNKKLIKEFGPNTALFVSNLIDKYKYFQDNNFLLEDGFYITHQKLTDEYGFTDRTIRNCKTTLKNKGIIETKLIGLPPKEYYFIDWEILLNTLNIYTKSSVRDIPDGNVRDKGNGTVRDNIIITNNKKTNKKTSSSFDLGNFDLKTKNITPKQFDKFWAIYPRKGSKGKALTEWNKICLKKERPTFRQIKNAILTQKESEQWQNPKFIPLPSTWLHQSRWLDDASELKGSWKKDTEENTFVPMFDELNYTRPRQEYD